MTDVTTEVERQEIVEKDKGRKDWEKEECRLCCAVRRGKYASTNIHGVCMLYAGSYEEQSLHWTTLGPVPQHLDHPFNHSSIPIIAPLG